MRRWSRQKQPYAAPRIRPESHDIPRRRLQRRRHAANGSGCSPPVDFRAGHVLFWDDDLKERVETCETMCNHSFLDVSKSMLNTQTRQWWERQCLTILLFCFLESFRCLPWWVIWWSRQLLGDGFVIDKRVCNMVLASESKVFLFFEPIRGLIVRCVIISVSLIDGLIWNK